MDTSRRSFLLGLIAAALSAPTAGAVTEPAKVILYPTDGVTESLKEAVQEALEGFLFEPSTQYTRERVRAVIENYLTRPELEDHFVLCDSSNNPDPEGLTVDVLYKPRGDDWRHIRSTL